MRRIERYAFYPVLKPKVLGGNPYNASRRIPPPIRFKTSRTHVNSGLNFKRNNPFLCLHKEINFRLACGTPIKGLHTTGNQLLHHIIFSNSAPKTRAFIRRWRKILHIKPL